jgi:DNA-directed RNA polymerase specialized sigma24 family protein
VNEDFLCFHPEREHKLHEALETTLLANPGAFKAFARSRLRDEQLAADAVQESLLRLLGAEHQLKDDENLLAWLYGFCGPC